MSSLSVAQALARAARRLADASVDTAALDAQVLLGDALGRDRAWLLAHPEALLTPDQTATFEEVVARRAAREPLAYIRGRREFWGLDFQVDPNVLMPRPETELLVERAMDLAQAWRRERGVWPRVVDVGVGSGAIVVSLAVSLPSLPPLLAVDISPAALEIAQANARRHGVASRIVFRHGDLLAGLADPVDLVVANLPYIERAVIPTLAPEVRREPALALDGGPDGLNLFRRLLAQLPAALTPGGWALLEIGAGQGQAVAALAEALRPAHIRVLPDLAGLDRLVEISL